MPLTLDVGFVAWIARSPYLLEITLCYTIWVSSAAINKIQLNRNFFFSEFIHIFETIERNIFFFKLFRACKRVFGIHILQYDCIVDFNRYTHVCVCVWTHNQHNSTIYFLFTCSNFGQFNPHVRPRVNRNFLYFN